MNNELNRKLSNAIKWYIFVTWLGSGFFVLALIVVMLAIYQNPNQLSLFYFCANTAITSMILFGVFGGIFGIARILGAIE